MSETEFIEWAEKLLNVTPGKVSLESELADIGWDSLINMTFIADFDNKFSKEVDADVLFGANTLRDIYHLVNSTLN